MERWWDDSDTVKPKQSGKDPSKCHVNHYIFHVDWTEFQAGPPRLTALATAGSLLPLHIAHISIHDKQRS
jgi:hypothetical protein